MRNDDWMSSQYGYFNNRAEDARVIRSLAESFNIDLTNSNNQRVQVSKATHRIRFEDETESSVVVVIEPKEGA